MLPDAGCAGEGDSDVQAPLVRNQLRKILTSRGFVQSARMRQFLELVVENSLTGNTPLKETMIGIRVFGRAPDYDSSLDPIVRVEARRLRQKLQHYYESEGAGDPVVIGLPKGGYTPDFQMGTVGILLPPEAPEAALQSDPAPPVITTALPARRPSIWLRYVSAVAALCGLAALSMWIAGSRPERPISSLSVLPLANLSGDPGQDYLADGMTDELIGSLARIPSLRVISRTSAMQYKGVLRPLPQIAKELHVEAIVEGTVTRSGREVRITAQLIDGKTDRHLWSADYNRSVDDLLEVQGEVARAIANQVSRTLSPDASSQFRADVDIAPEAYDAYLKGRYFWNKRTEEGLRTSIDFFHQALAKAPDYSLAWAGLADSYLLLGENWVRPPGESFAKARDAADRALKLNDFLGEAHAARAALAQDQGNWSQAEREFRRALRLTPGYATAHQWYAEGLAAHGRFTEALAEIQHARRLDPLSLIINVQVGYIDYQARLYDDAISELRAAIQMDPQFFFAHADLGQAYTQKGLYVEALAELQKAADLSNGDPGEILWLARAEALAGQRRQALRTSRSLEEAFQEGRVPANCMALLDLALGAPDRAVHRLQDACSAHKIGPIAGPEFDPLRTDPRTAAVMEGCRAGD